MLTRVAAGVQVHVSDFMQSNAVLVEGEAGVLLIDPGIRTDELEGIVVDLRETDRAVVAGFSTHPHWDHLLWHAGFGTAPRYGTAAAAAVVAARLSGDDWMSIVTPMIPADLVDRVPLDVTFAKIVALPAETVRVPWDGPEVLIIEHQAHAAGHAALLIPEHGVLVAGDMLSDTLVPIVNAMAPDPAGSYLAALEMFAAAAGRIDVVIPGHGSVGTGADLHARIEQDREYLRALHDGRMPDDPRLGAAAPYGAAMTGITERQLGLLSASPRRGEQVLDQ